MSDLTKPMLDELRTVFNQLDRDQSNSIDLAEFCLAVRQLGGNETTARRDYPRIDSDQDGLIDFSEFSSWWLESG